MSKRVDRAPGTRKNLWLQNKPKVYKVLFYLFLFIPIFQETSGDLSEFFGRAGSGTQQESEAPSSFTLYDSYNNSFKLLNSTHAPRSDQVIAMGIPANLFPVQSNLCMGRLFMAVLLREIFATQPGEQQQVPTVVAIDKYYGDDSCQQGDEASFTAALDQSMAQVPKGHTVVVGLANHLADQSECKCPQPGCTCLMEDRSHTFPKGVGAGYVRTNEDPLHIPLRWDGLPQHDGFALTAARAADPRIMNRVDRIYRGNLQIASWFPPALGHSVEHPFGYLPPAVITEPNARDFFCHTLAPDAEQPPVALNAQDKAAWAGFILNQCGKAGAPQRSDKRAEYRMAFAGKLIVIGSEDNHDTYSVLDERIPGYQLQARYMAALLGGAYLREWPLWLLLPVSILLMFLVERVFIVWGARGHFYRWQWRDLFWNKHSHYGKRGGKYPAFLLALALLLLPFVASLVGVRFGWLPPFPLLALSLTIMVLKVYALLDELNKDAAKKHSERREAV